MRGELLAEDGGPEKWQQFRKWLHTPPAAPTPGRGSSSLAAAARAAVGDEAAAFDALEAMQQGG